MRDASLYHRDYHIHIHNDCDYTVIVRHEVNSDVMDTVDPSQVHPPGGGLFPK